MEAVTLRTARLLLSRPVAADVDAIFAACQDPQIQRYTTVPSPYRREHAEGFPGIVDDLLANDRGAHWAIRDGDRIVGMIGVDRFDGSGAGEIGYWMVPDARGRGALTEAGHAVVDWAFSSAGLTRIQWMAIVGNRGSARVARRLGFSFEGTLRLGYVGNRGREDAWIGGLLSTDSRDPKRWPVDIDG